MKPNIYLRLARRDAGLTQEDLAEELDISSMTVYRWESGQRLPGRFQLARLCTLFGKTAAELGWAETDIEKEQPMLLNPSLFFDPSVPVGRPVLAGQGELLKTLQAHCLVPSRRRRVGLIGIPGCGKTAVAVALLAMPKIQHYFAGVLWATVGQVSTPRSHLQRWAHLLSIELPDELEKAKELLRLAIGTRRVLIILDDIWDLLQIPDYQIGGPGCQYVLTTRQTAMAYNICDVVYRPAALTPTQALHLLCSALPPLHERECKPMLQRFAVQVGNLPLALELAGGYLRREASTDSHRRIQAAVSSLTHPACYLHHCSEQGSVFTAIQRSEQRLSVAARKALVCLATHYAGAPATFSERQALQTLQLQELHVQELDALLDSGLLDAVGNNHYQIHPIIAAYVQYLYARLGSACSFEER